MPDLSLHSLDKRVTTIEQWKDEAPGVTDLKIKSEISSAVNRLLLWFAGLLIGQSVIERLIGL